MAQNENKPGTDKGTNPGEDKDRNIDPKKAQPDRGQTPKKA